MAGQHAAVFFRLVLFQAVAYHHRSSAEHAVHLLDRGLEQGPGIVAGGFNVGTGLAFAPENQLEHVRILTVADRPSAGNDYWLPLV